jgi:tyrosine-protein kinase Etk/Wzc
MNSQKQPNLSVINNENDILTIIKPYVSKWYWIIGGLILLNFLAFLYLRYTIPKFDISSKVLVRIEERNKSNINLDVLDGETYLSNSSSVDDEIEIFKANSVVGPVVDSLNLRSSVFLLGHSSGVKRAEMFNNMPFEIQLIDQIDGHHPTFKLLIDWKENSKKVYFANKKYNISSDTIIYLNDILPKIKINQSKSVIGKNMIFGEYEINVISRENAISQFVNSLKIEKIKKESNILTISMNGSNENRISKSIELLIESYQKDVLDDRSQMKRNTISFIEDRMRYLVKELEDVEKYGESYKLQSNVNDYNINLVKSLEGKSDYDNKLKENEIQLGLVEFLLEFITNSNSTDDLLPSNLGFTDGTINLLIDQYNKIILEKSKLSVSSKSNNPLIVNMENQLRLIKVNIEKSLKNFRKTAQSKVSEYQKTVFGIKQEMRYLPKFEREYRAILRQQQIKETLYIYLLQKREENEIELAANTSSLKVITPPSSKGVVVFPQQSLIYLASSVIGIIIPLILIYILNIFNNKISEELSINPLVEIGKIPKTKVTGLNNENRNDNLLLESFKAIRTNLYFYLGENKKIIGVTSSFPDEGKTFISLNIAEAYRQTGKKVVLVGTDLRRSGSEVFFTNLNELGLSNYLTSSELTINDIINPIATDFYLITKGISPPNPSELLLRPRMDYLMEELKKEFDIIILDTSPVDVVSDCLPVLKKYADFVLFVVKCGSTPIEALNTPKRLLEEGIVENLAIVKNNTIRQSKSYYGSYYY